MKKNKVIEEYQTRGLTNKPTTFYLIKRKQGNYGVYRGKRMIAFYDSFWMAKEKFENIKKQI